MAFMIWALNSFFDYTLLRDAAKRNWNSLRSLKSPENAGKSRKKPKKLQDALCSISSEFFMA